MEETNYFVPKTYSSDIVDLDLDLDLDLNLDSVVDNVADINLNIDNNTNSNIVDLPDVIDIGEFVFETLEADNLILPPVEVYKTNADLILSQVQQSLKDAPSLIKPYEEAKSALTNIINNTYTNNDLSIWLNHTTPNIKKKTILKSGEQKDIVFNSLYRTTNNIEDIEIKENILNSEYIKQAVNSIGSPGVTLEDGLHNIETALQYEGLEEKDIDIFIEDVLDKLLLTNNNLVGDFSGSNLIVDIVSIDRSGLFTFNCPVCGKQHTSKIYNIDFNYGLSIEKMSILTDTKYLTHTPVKCTTTGQTLIINPKIDFMLLEILKKSSTGVVTNTTKVYNELNYSLKEEFNIIEDVRFTQKNYNLINLLNTNISDWNVENYNIINSLNRDNKDLGLTNKLLEMRIQSLKFGINIFQSKDFHKMSFNICKTPLTKYFIEISNKLQRAFNLLGVLEFEINKLVVLTNTKNLPQEIYQLNKDGEILDYKETLTSIKSLILKNLEEVYNLTTIYFDLKDFDLNSFKTNLQNSKTTLKFLKELQTILLTNKSIIYDYKQTIPELLLNFNLINAYTVYGNETVIQDDDPDLIGLYELFSSEESFTNYLNRIELSLLQLGIMDLGLNKFKNDTDIFFNPDFESRYENLRAYIDTHRDSALIYKDNKTNKLRTSLIFNQELSSLLLFNLQNGVNLTNLKISKSKENPQLIYRLDFDGEETFNNFLTKCASGLFTAKEELLFNFKDVSGLFDALSITINNTENSPLILGACSPEFIYDTYIKFKDYESKVLISLSPIVETSKKDLFNILNLNKLNIRINNLVSMFNNEVYLYKDITIHNIQADEALYWGRNEIKESFYKILEYPLNNMNKIYLSKDIFNKLSIEELNSLDMSESIDYLITLIALFNSEQISSLFSYTGYELYTENDNKLKPLLQIFNQSLFKDEDDRILELPEKFNLFYLISKQFNIEQYIRDLILNRNIRIIE